MLIAGACRDAVRRDAAEGEDYWPASIARSLISSWPVGPCRRTGFPYNSGSGGTPRPGRQTCAQDLRFARPQRRNHVDCSRRPRRHGSAGAGRSPSNASHQTLHGVVPERDAEAAHFEQGAREGLGRAHADNALAVGRPEELEILEAGRRPCLRRTGRNRMHLARVKFMALKMRQTGQAQAPHTSLRAVSPKLTRSCRLAAPGRGKDAYVSIV